MNGVLIVDKPSGCTSHDVVQRIRRLLHTRSVGHAGTLDPLATGVLVVAIGEATKLVSYLQTADKAYEVSMKLGVQTDTLDADGAVTAQAPVPTLSRAVVEEAARSFLGVGEQRVPKYSAVKVDGRPLPRKARAGAVVEAPVRKTRLDEVAVTRIDGDEVDLTLRCAKGFFVRSFVRDLGAHLGTVAHVASLRRTESGSFSLASAVALEGLTPDVARARLLSLTEALADMPKITLDQEGADHAFHGRRVPDDTVVERQPCSENDAVALVRQTGGLVAIARRQAGGFKVVRGFRDTAEA